MISKIKSWIAWWHDPDQTLLRIETRWVLRWFRSFPGMIALFTYICADLLIHFREDIYQWIAGTSYPVHYPKMSLFYFTKSFFWIYFIRTRIGGFLRPDRLSELVVTPCEGKMIWPALCVAPILGTAFLIVVDFEGTYFLDVLIDVIRWEQDHMFSVYGVIMDLLLFIPVLLLVFGVASYLIAGMTLYAVSRTAPHFGVVGLVCYGFVAWLRLFLPCSIPLLLFIFASQVIPIPIADTRFVWGMFGFVIPVNFLLFGWMTNRIMKEALQRLRREITPEKLWQRHQDELNSRTRIRSEVTGEE